MSSSSRARVPTTRARHEVAAAIEHHSSAMPPPGPRTLGLGSGFARWIISARREERDRWFTDKRRTAPDAKVVVSDGDSWFLHPLLYDVIDRLAGICAVPTTRPAT